MEFLIVTSNVLLVSLTILSACDGLLSQEQNYKYISCLVGSHLIIKLILAGFKVILLARKYTIVCISSLTLCHSPHLS